MDTSSFTVVLLVLGFGSRAYRTLSPLGRGQGEGVFPVAALLGHVALGVMSDRVD